ncbi:MAG: MoxR family ATPase [Gemmatimonadota bacterium]
MSLERHGYVAGPDIATALYLMRELGRPLLVEGDAGVGKTEIAKVLASILETELIRLQCYEGLDVHTALYEWDVQRQLLRLRVEQAAGADADALEQRIFSREYLLERPLLRALTREEGPAVLLIDEIDRADDAFEAFLLEVLSDFQVSIPELGVVHAAHVPHVILTSNRTRELGDALRRRCLYLYIDHPSVEKEIAILTARVPELDGALARDIARFMHTLRGRSLVRTPGVAETLDWARALLGLERTLLDPEVVRDTLGCIIKDRADARQIASLGTEALLREAGVRATA